MAGGKDSVKGGFCLINYLSGACECQIFGHAWPHFCGVVKFMTHAAELIPTPLVSSSASALFLKGLAAARTDLSLSFLPSCEAIPQTPKTPFSDKFSSSAAPRVSHNRFIKHTGKAFLRGTLTVGANSPLNTPE